MPMTIDYTAYDNAHSQPFDRNALACQTDDWRLYDAAHADPAAVPIESIQASPANIVEAGATVHNDTSEPTAESENHMQTLAQYEAIAPGLALAILQAEQSRDKQRRQYRMARLAVTTLIATTAIACGQWALVNGADQQALYLSTAGLISLITTVLQHK